MIKAHLCICCKFWIKVSQFMFLSYVCISNSRPTPPPPPQPTLLFNDCLLILVLPLKILVEAIMEIKKWYKVRRNWQGDPCVPSNYSWDGLNCNNDNPPRIISLNLSSSNLTGDIATSFSKLELLQSLDLSFNNLTGPLPQVLELLPNLNTLDLRGN
ncbi:probable LRR receptor-like serine/threonine-protein kinase At1g05700 [Juglans microcarpa x Juglans regia]|uniref:probable LRR receptor-like serine/threonine-protein kinase At1g05700 n=1 Tax=Juglans microcarpa x Juglans regia TaxID=2249226 RepID=UPI001B7F49C1|nr:probable LRR receptor-like serine/threonine-protein kinase At1g05700 [Juglans microcarpa x Juglans regia]